MISAALLQVTLYGAGPGSLNIGQPGLVRSGIFNTVGSCSVYSCQYTTTQPCAQKNSAGGRALEVLFSCSASEFARLQYPTLMQGGGDFLSDMSTSGLTSALPRRQCSDARISVRG